MGCLDPFIPAYKDLLSKNCVDLSANGYHAEFFPNELKSQRYMCACDDGDECNTGDKECHCPNEAKAIAVKTKAKTQFVVAGEKTCCSVQSRLNLARAKYKAAVEAVVTTDKKTESDKS